MNPDINRILLRTAVPREIEQIVGKARAVAGCPGRRRLRWSKWDPVTAMDVESSQILEIPELLKGQKLKYIA